MASTRRRSHPSLIADLERTPGGFELFQVMRLAERVVARQRRAAGRPLPDAAGRGVDPAQASVRLRSGTQLAYAGDEVSSVRFNTDGPAEILQNVVGLLGSTGTMPHAFSELVQTSVRDRNTGLRSFLDLFNDRLGALLYDAFAKYRIEIETERADLTRITTIDDLIRSLVGLGGRPARSRLGTPDPAILHHAGLLSRHSRSVHAVERTLSSTLGQTVLVEQFVGEWLPIAPSERTRLAIGREPGDTFARLGRDAVVGERVWSVQGCVRLCVGPLGYDVFESFLPGGERDTKLRSMAGFALGADTAFGLRLTLKAPDVPPFRLGGAPGAGKASRLGWNTWVSSASDRVDTGIVDLPATSALNPHHRTIA